MCWTEEFGAVTLSLACLLVLLEATMASLTDASTGSLGVGSRGRDQGPVEKEDIEGLLRRLSENVRDTRWTTVCASIQSNWSGGLASKSATKSSEWVPRGKITDVAFVPKNDPAPCFIDAYCTHRFIR